MKRMIYVLALVVAFIGMAQAQEKASDAAKVYVLFSNASTEAGGVQNAQGVNAGIQFRLYGYENVKLEAVGDFAGYFNDTQNFYTYLAGPQVGVNLLEGRLNPFVNLKFGVLRIADTNFYTHSVGGGVDFNINRRFGVRAFQYDQVSPEGGPRFQRISTGIYFRP